MADYHKTAVITGATSGIGKAVAEALAADGYGLVITGRNETVLKDLAGTLGCGFICSEINEASLPQRLYQMSLNRFGRCDVLINNAGMIESGDIATIDIDRVSEMVRTNVEAPFRFVYTFVKKFLGNRKGHIINISSVMGTKVRETAGAYAGTKYAIEALSEALRMELADTDIKITCIEPGLVRTQLHRKWEKHPSEALGIPNPLNPEDIAEVVRDVLSKPDRLYMPRVMILPKSHKI